ncbi:MAG: tRNA (N(6)-L-threonylcarbamoyladenosine(37)-C(2))-methylthiotransferase MtaB [Defluviitaleaceae bacterium]|nr:tRNA (N(6)-L-threonylcarbamoyladenosine(37)-C(2))-methylthiotransferase MtaB [Defluviitaleaceae bacterium]
MQNSILTIAVHTLGCKVNKCDAEALVNSLKGLGYNAFFGFDVAADVFVINTCTVTHVSDRKSRQMVRRAKKLNPDAFVAMCGCMIKDSIDGVDFVFDAREPDMFFEKIREIPPKTATPLYPKDIKNTRSFIKIQDGCDRFCSYCIVPYVRGRLKSRLSDEIFSEAESLIKSGAPEIVLTGIQVASYGYDTEESDLPSIIKKIASIQGIKRLRLSSIDPWAISEKFLSAVKESQALCSHFHLSLQSGCDTTLEKMNRKYTTKDYAKAANELRKIRPDAALTTDIIVGFPGESDSDFEQSLDFAREMEFAKIHVFEFSPRKGTPAAEFSGQVPHKIKSERGKIMRELALNLQRKFLQKQVGKIQNVLFEKNKTQGIYQGNSENYCLVQVKNDKNLRGTIKKVKITACEGETLIGNLL